MTSPNAGYGERFLNELDLITAVPGNTGDRFTQVHTTFRKLVIHITNREKRAFGNFYARFRYILMELPFSETEVQNLNAFRRLPGLRAKIALHNEMINQGVMLVKRILYRLQHQAIPAQPGYKEDYFSRMIPRAIPGQQRDINVLCTACSAVVEENGLKYFTLSAYDLDDMEGVLTIDIGEHQSGSASIDFTYIRDLIAADAILSLKNLASKGKNHYATRHDSILVLEPDFLMDVTSIGECFNQFGANEDTFFLSKIVENLPGAAALKGTIVGACLDELICNNEKGLDEVFDDAQRDNALKAAYLGQLEMREIRRSVKTEHAGNIRMLVKEESIRKVWVEPTYFSAQYGLQGRLDMLAIDQDKESRNIIELKSGSPSNPEMAIAWQNHKIQVVGYDLLLKSTYGEERRGTNAVFYSKCTISPYRNIVTEHREWHVMLRLRNKIVSKLYAFSRDDYRFLQRIKDNGVHGLSKFSEPELQRFQALYDPTRIATQYYQALVAFTVRELINAKVGHLLREEEDTNNGFAAFWKDNTDYKKEAFRIISNLRIVGKNIQKGQIRLQMSEPMSHAFRKGDLVILYPETENCLGQHILKGSIETLGQDHITISIHNKQTYYAYFDEFEYWAVEPDLYERNFWSVISSLFNVLAASERKKRLILGHDAPFFADRSYTLPATLSADQYTALKDALSADDYYLLQGPPGTGKTSTFLVNYLRCTLQEGKAPVFVLAFTNAAVEGICQQLKHPRDGDPVRYLRIGSKYVEDDQLFAIQIANEKDPDVWRQIAQSHTVIVTTVATFQNNLLLLQRLYAFKQVVVDEASQLTEAQLAGVLAVFDKFVLIGDHKQLPSVVTQDERLCITAEEGYLWKLGIRDFRVSLFERLFRNAYARKWTNAYGQLTNHYRMHQQIAALISRHYLKPLLPGKQAQQDSSAPYQLHPDDPFYQVSKSRTVFIETKNGNGLKRNPAEARIVSQLVSMLHQQAGLQLKDIGIITPFRAQIAEIKSLLPADWLEDGALMIDTVERFQGNEKKVIIFSTTVSSPKQAGSIQSIANEDSSMTDRKLLVGLSRAIMQVIVLGSPEAIGWTAAYRELISDVKRNGGYVCC